MSQRLENNIRLRLQTGSLPESSNDKKFVIPPVPYIVLREHLHLPACHLLLLSVARFYCQHCDC